jgi:hypothetical protein
MVATAACNTSLTRFALPTMEIHMGLLFDADALQMVA